MYDVEMRARAMEPPRQLLEQWGLPAHEWAWIISAVCAAAAVGLSTRTLLRHLRSRAQPASRGAGQRGIGERGAEHKRRPLVAPRPAALSPEPRGARWQGRPAGRES